MEPKEDEKEFEPRQKIESLFYNIFQGFTEGLYILILLRLIDEFPN